MCELKLESKYTKKIFLLKYPQMFLGTFSEVSPITFESLFYQIQITRTCMVMSHLISEEIIFKIVLYINRIYMWA